MALEKPIIKAKAALATTFDYKARTISVTTSDVAKSYVDEDARRSPDFKLSDLIAEQAGISRLESDAHQDRINRQVLERLKEIEEGAYKEGYALGNIEGTEKAFQEAKADFLDRLGAMEKLLKRIEDLKERLLIDNERALIDLVFFTAKKMALRDLSENHEAVLEILKHVVGEFQEDERVTVRLSPEDLFFIESLQDKSGQHIESLKRIKFIPDDNIKTGGCQIDTGFGSVNATVQERVERTWQTLQARIPHKPDESDE